MEAPPEYCVTRGVPFSVGSTCLRYASTAAVFSEIVPSPLTVASPVIMPTFSAPNCPHSAKNFSLTSALIGEV